MNDEYYTVKDVAELLKCSTKSIYRMINTEGLPSLNIRNITRIPKSELNAFLESKTVVKMSILGTPELSRSQQKRPQGGRVWDR